VVFGGGQAGGVDFGADARRGFCLAGVGFANFTFAFPLVALSDFRNWPGRRCGRSLELVEMADIS
jgi:hypothetical protein